MVDLCALHLGGHPVGERRDPFPVEDMAQIDGAGESVGEVAIEVFNSFKHQSLANLVFAHGHHLDGFDEIIAELLVELSLDGFQFGLVFLGETLAEVFSDDAMAVAHHLGDEQVEYV